MNQRNRDVVLYIVLGGLISAIVLSVVTHQPVPSEVYAALGALGGYVLLRESKNGDSKGGSRESKDRDDQP